MFPVLFSDSRYGVRLPIGDKTILEAYKPATLKRFYDTWYRPDLMAVVAVGDFNKQQIEGLIKRYLGEIPRSTNPRARTLFPVPRHDSTLVSINRDKEATRSVIRLLYKEPKRSNTTTATYRERLVEQLFGGMFNDRFSEITQKPNPPFINAYAAQGGLVRSAESFSLTAVVADNGIQRGLSSLLTEGERVRKFGFLQSELDRARKDMQRGIERHMRSGRRQTPVVRELRICVRIELRRASSTIWPRSPGSCQPSRAKACPSRQWMTTPIVCWLRHPRQTRT